MQKIIVGIDEAGRGPLAGRVYAAAVILDPKKIIIGLNDSKKLTSNQRQNFYDEIKSKSIAYGICYSTHDEIDKINILQATFLAMQRALEKIDSNYDIILVDGNQFPFASPLKGQSIIKGDTKIPEIMAASILAKVTRDNYMEEMDKKYPQYQFAKHKGYPTALHRELIIKHGPCPIHRKSFKRVREFVKFKEKS